MSQLQAQYSASFERDVKRLRKKHINELPLEQVIDLIVENSDDSLAALRQRHNMHTLYGSWAGSFECHVCNAGDWLLIWRVFDGIALLQRTGTHDELFRRN